MLTNTVSRRKSTLWVACAAMLMAPLTSLAVEPGTALDGACPVCLLKMDKVVQGNGYTSSVYDGKKYLFPGSKQKRMFDENPAAFVPAFGGKCVVCKVEKNKDVKGSVEFHVTHNGRLYLFPSQMQLDMFKKNPDKYASVDLALGGQCSVCKIEMGKNVAGDTKFSVDHGGLRYLFPGTKQRDMFLSNPARYAVKK